MKALVILNPQTGDQQRQRLLASLGTQFAAASIAYAIYETRKGDRLAEIVRRRLGEGFDLVVAAGGDGTVSAVSDSLVNRSIPLGIIPTGTGNAIACELGIPDNMEAAIALIAGAPRLRKIDALRIGARAYVLNASVGISAAVVGATSPGIKSRLGRLAYYATGFRKVLASRPRQFVVQVDETIHRVRAVEVAILNCALPDRMPYPKGPGMQIDDGHLGIWILSLQSIWEYPGYIRSVVGNGPLHPAATFLRAGKSVRIQSDVPLPVQADGDIIGSTPLEVTVLPGALAVLVPNLPVVASEASQPPLSESRTA